MLKVNGIITSVAYTRDVCCRASYHVAVCVAALGMLGTSQFVQAQHSAQARIDLGSIKINVGDDRYRSKPRHYRQHNTSYYYRDKGRRHGRHGISRSDYERYRQDCAEYLRAYGTGKSCHFPSQISSYPYGASGHYHSVVSVQHHQHDHNGFRIIHGTQARLPAGWSRHLNRGDILDIQLYKRGRVTYRSPRGIVRIKLGDTTIQLKEHSREIISVINR